MRLEYILRFLSAAQNMKNNKFLSSLHYCKVGLKFMAAGRTNRHPFMLKKIEEEERRE